MRKIHQAISLAVLLPAATLQLNAQQVSIPAGTALRVEIDKHVRIRNGASVTGHLTQPVFTTDHELIPVGSVVTGKIKGTRPGPKSDHVRRLLAADFTPPRIPDIVFETILAPPVGPVPARSISIYAPATPTDASVLSLGAKQPKRSLVGLVIDQVKQAKRDTEEIFREHEEKEIIEKWVVGQLPYHPEIVWKKARFNADLRDSVDVADVPHLSYPVEDLRGHLPEGTLHARLLSQVTSATAKRGDAVEAITTQPLLSPDGTTLLVPEGTLLHGKVVQTKAARSFGRNGSLRLTFTRIDVGGPDTKPASLEIHGRISAAETAPGANVSVDEEGQTKANDTPAKYIEPGLLAILAIGAGPDDDHSGTTAAPGADVYGSNGMGLIARVVSISTRNVNVVQGFAYYSLAKSVYYRFVARGHETSFDHDTEVQVTLSER